MSKLFIVVGEIMAQAMFMALMVMLGISLIGLCCALVFWVVKKIGQII